MTTDLAASVAIIQDGRVLLTKRDDVEAWALPGGRVEIGESVVEAARREALEETGLEIAVTRLVGIYFWPSGPAGDNHTMLFAAAPTGGNLRPQTGEVVELDYFDPRVLPEPLLWWHQQRIQDAISGARGVIWTQRVPWPFKGLTRQAIQERLAPSGLSKQAFFADLFSRPDPDPGDLEVLHLESPEELRDKRP